MEANTNERIPPHNDEAEKSVLGALMLDKDALLDVMEILKEDDFYSEAHKKIFLAAKSLYRLNKPVDIVTVSDELGRQKDLEIAGGRAYVSSLPSMAPTISNADQYARIVSEKAILRRLIKASSEIMDNGFQGSRDAREVLDSAERSILEIAQYGQRKEFTHIKDVLWENVNRIDEISKIKGLTGLTTGYADLDKKTSGLQKSDLIIVAARPGMGKTAFALNIAHRAATRAKANVLVFSLEMSKGQLANRILSLASNVEITRLRDGKLNDEDWANINDALDVLADTSIFIDDTPSVPVLEIKNKARRMKAERGLDLIIVDYLQLIPGDGHSENRQLEISSISRMLKALAREMDCPVIVLSQLSRAVEQRGKGNRRPILSDLRDSGAIEQDADIVIFLYREDYYDDEEPEEDQNVCEVNIAKHRNGETDRIYLTWVGKYTKFADKAYGERDD
ncbi:MAG: replicative DNA helicase [Clostridiales Family XIII bacterium]|jgi:replicative DNA helicase|nr:replicative DNA helicase [Clostridiales Family XIII bacterium]